MSNNTYTAWWKSTDYAYKNTDTGNFVGDGVLAGANWYLHVLPGLMAGLIAIIFVGITYSNIKNYEVKNNAVKQLGVIINQGAKDFLTAEYKWLFVFVTFIFIAVSCLLIGSKNSVGEAVPEFGLLTALPLLFGALLSSYAGWFGMDVATLSNTVTVEAANKSINEGLRMAFKSGSVMGFSVTGFGISGLSIMYLIFRGALTNPLEADVWQYLSGFGFGASCIALFARVGGGIYTKAADVGADLVGKVEADVPEDHPNNAAVIADNVGDNVGDVAGMGADLFESYVGSIIAACTLATQQFNATTGTLEIQRSAIALPFWISGFGIICSMIGTAFVTTDTEVVDPGEDASSEEKFAAANKTLNALLSSINRGIRGASLMVVVCAAVCCAVMFKDVSMGWRIFAAIIIGLLSGILIGAFTEYCTSYTEAPTQGIAKKGETGPATVIIQGLGVGMIGTAVPTFIIVIAICACNALVGLYGISIAAVGMLSTLGITLATDAYGPVADNAGGIAEMVSDVHPDEGDPDYLKESVRDNTDALDAMGNTTAATGKGFAIGSAVLTSAGLIAAFMDAAGVPATGINIREPLVLSGVLIGASLPFIFAAITMLSVGRAAEAMIYEVRAQFAETPELKMKKYLKGQMYKVDTGKDANGKQTYGAICEEGDDKAIVFLPDYKECIKISTDASIYEMLIPGCMAVFMPIAIGFLLTSKGLAGMLVGALSSGFMLAVTMSNAGGAWDNAKKFVEKTEKKGTDKHSATVTGDTVGDPFKDTSGPALNILIKLMSVISLVIAPQLKALQIKNGIVQDWETTGVIIGAIILVLLFGFTYFWQGRIDAFYKAKEQDMIQRQKANADKIEAAKKAAEAEETDAGPTDLGDVEMVAKTDDDKAETEEVAKPQEDAKPQEEKKDSE
jgi:K(+)-stimulated pyrophosphate-energized sodium pump